MIPTHSNMFLNPKTIMLLPVLAGFRRMLLKTLGALAATVLKPGFNGDQKMSGWFDPGPTWPLWPSEVAQSSHPCLTPYNGLRFISFTFLSCVISMCRPEKRPSLESCHDSSALELGLHEFMPKNPNSEFELLKCNKAPFPCLPPFFPSAPNRWQMWSFLVMWAFSCWAGKIEASSHFLENPISSKLFFLSPNNSHERQRGRKKKAASVVLKRP